MTCEEARLAIETGEDAAAHVTQCDACRVFAANVDAEQELFAAFGASIEPRRDVWPSIQKRLEDTGSRTRWPRVAVAACLAAIIAGTTYVMLRETAPATPPRVAERTAPMPIGNPVVHEAETRYVAAESLLRSELGASAIELAALDARIAATRAAVVAAPDDPIAVARWRAAYDRKIDALRKAVEARS